MKFMPESERIILAVCEASGLSRKEIMTRCHEYRISHPRQIAQMMLRDNLPLSTTQIGRIFGGQDHTSVIYNVKRARQRIEEDPAYREIHARATRALGVTLPLVPPIHRLPHGRWRRVCKAPEPVVEPPEPPEPLWKRPKAKHVQKNRVCLTCREEFPSSWPGERICGDCKDSKHYRAASALPNIGGGSCGGRV